MNNFDDLIAGRFVSRLTYEFWPAQNTESRKLLVVLHGRGDSKEGYYWLPEALNIDDFNYLFLDGPDVYGTGRSWYGLLPERQGIPRSRDLLTELLQKIQSDCGLKPGEIYLFGFSQGCLMSLDVALRLNVTLGGIVGVSGSVAYLDQYPTALGSAARAQRFLITHGYGDDVTPLEPTQKGIETLRRQGVAIDFRVYDKAHNFDEIDELPDIEAYFNRLLDLC